MLTKPLNWALLPSGGAAKLIMGKPPEPGRGTVAGVGEGVGKGAGPGTAAAREMAAKARAPAVGAAAVPSDGGAPLPGARAMTVKPSQARSFVFGVAQLVMENEPSAATGNVAVDVGLAPAQG